MILHTINKKSRAYVWSKLNKHWDPYVYYSVKACHPCAGAMLIFSGSFQFFCMSPQRATSAPARFWHSFSNDCNVQAIFATRSTSSILKNAFARFGPSTWIIDSQTGNPLAFGTLLRKCAQFATLDALDAAFEICWGPKAASLLASCSNSGKRHTDRVDAIRTRFIATLMW